MSIARGFHKYFSLKYHLTVNFFLKILETFICCYTNSSLEVVTHVSRVLTTILAMHSIVSSTYSECQADWA